MNEGYPAVEVSRHGYYPRTGNNVPYNRNATYKGYQPERRRIAGSPEGNNDNKIISPSISPLGKKSGFMSESMKWGNSESQKDTYPSFLSDSGKNSTGRSYHQKTLSPPATEVSMPGGVIYTIGDEKKVQQDRQNNSTMSHQSYNRVRSGEESNASRRSIHSQIGNRSSRRSSISRDEYDDEYKYRNRDRRNHRYDNDDYRGNRRMSRHPEYSDDDSEYESDRDSHSSGRSERNRQKREEEKKRNLLMDMLFDDYMERKKKEKEAEEQKKNQSQSQTKTQSNLGPGFEIPKTGDHVPQKSRIPNYEDYSDIEKEKVKEKFRNNYNTLIVSYPKWKIELPDFDLLPLRLIHERYETVIRTICIYQTAMKWKVYLIIIIAGIEYYGYNIKKYAFLKGLLKEQIKSIHKYDNYLVEFAGMFFSDEVGDDYPVWMRFLGTFASSLGCFSSINGIVKLLGKDASPPEFVFEQADRFVSPPEGTAKLHSDGISDVPDVPTGMQDSNNLIGIIGNLFGMFTGQNKPTDQNSNTTGTAQTAVPVEEKPKIVDDYENADF